MNSLISFFFVCLCASVVNAQSARDIVAESQMRNSSNSQRYTGSLKVVSSNRHISEKTWTYERLGAYGNSKTLLRFTAPAEVKGVALLVVNHPDRSSDQWMWTPATGRDRRIALQDRSTRFFGTDFSFEDLEERDVDQYDFKLLGEDAAVWKIESRPRKGKSSQYTSTVLHIRKDNYVPVLYENYSNDQLVRRLKQTDIEKTQNIWTARTLDMEDLKRKSRTILHLDKLEYNVPLKEDAFTVQALRQ